MENEKKLQLTIDKIEKDYGVGTVIGGNESRAQLETVSTGSLSLDIATGVGGLPIGKVVELMGWESSGKSTITLNVIANAQKKGLRCLLVDGESSFDQKYAKALGVDLEKLLMVQMDEEGGEKCYDSAERLLREDLVDVIVFDSQTSLLPKKCIEEPVGTANMGLHARMMGMILPKFTTLAAKHNCLIVFISQYREKIGVMFGSPITTNGGNALKFYAHMRIEVSKSLQKVGDVAHHNLTKCKVVKNKCASPHGTAEFDIIFGEGIDSVGEILMMAVEKEIVKKSGSWFSYNNDKLGQGKEAARQLLKDNPELLEEIKNKVLAG